MTWPLWNRSAGERVVRKLKSRSVQRCMWVMRSVLNAALAVTGAGRSFHGGGPYLIDNRAADASSIPPTKAAPAPAGAVHLGR